MRYIKYHDSKKMAFPHTCPKCGKVWRRNSKNRQGQLCSKCGTPNRMIAPERMSVCAYCPMEQDCMMRVSLGIWLYCETPDIADLERLLTTGGLNDERVRTAVEASLDGGGSRKILEEAISQSAPKIYQSIVERSKGQMSIGIRV